MGVQVARIFATDQSPPPARRPAARGERIDVNLAPGLMRWNVVDHLPQDAPTVATTMHHKDTIDLVIVQDGTAELVLDDGRHPVGPGDCIVMPGNDHALVPGPAGCRVIAFVIGTPPPEAHAGLLH
jgi:mannose-6-phosphate isomerase-like protein (cupin superfamily)